MAIAIKNTAINYIEDGNFFVDVSTRWEPLAFFISKDNGVTYTETTATSDTLENGKKRWKVPCEDGDYVKLVRGGSAPAPVI